MSMNKKTTPTDPKEDKKQLWTGRFTDAEGNQSELFTAFQRWYDSFYAVFKEKVAPWRSKVLDPKIASKAVNVIAKIALYEPSPNLHPRSKYDFVKAKNNQELIEYQLDNPDFDLTMFHKRYSVTSDMVITGMGLALLPWKKIDKKIMKRVMTKGEIDFSKDKEIIEKIGFNDFIPWSVFRAYCEPGASSWQSARWTILVDFKDDNETKDFLKDKGFTLDLEKLKGNGAGPSQYEQSRNRFLNQTDRKGKREIWICYDANKKEFDYFVDRNFAGTEKNIYWHGKNPIIPFYLRPRAFNPWGDGIFERSERLGEANNSLINHFLDQLDLSMNGLIMHDDSTIVEADMTPGGEITYSGTKPEQWAVQQPDAAGFQLAREVINEAIEENTLSNYEVGTTRSGMDKTMGTAQGINAIQDAAGDMVRLFKKSFGESCKMWFSQWLSNNMQFLDRKVAVRVLGANGYYPKELTPEDIATQGTLDIDIDVDTLESRNKDTERSFKLAYVDKQLAIYQNSLKSAKPVALNFFEMSKMVGEAMRIKEIDRIVEPVAMENDSPTTENELMLTGKELEPQQGEDHTTHLFIHQELMDDKGVDQSLKTDIITPHIKIHEMYLEQIKKQAEDAARIAKQGMTSPNPVAQQLNGGANALQPNPEGQVPPQAPGQGVLPPEMAGAGQAGQGVGSGNPIQRL